jgi:glycosyltransferase involved in cell wall biosynthesis
MDTSYQRPLRVAVVITRDLSERNGRTPILSHIVRALAARHEIELLHLPTLVESRDLIDAAGALAAWMASLCRGRPLPLQCLLYASPRQCRAIAARIADTACDTVYLDTVRCQQLLRILRRRSPGLHIVTDFDDLMSRRAGYLFRNRLPFATGHVGRRLPGWLRFLPEKLLARPIAAYEALTLPAAEDEVIAASDATILISSADRDKLGARMPVDTVHAIPPAVAAVCPPRDTPPTRFVFIGSDEFIHNRAAIDFLLQTWRAIRPPLDLHIYGQQSRVGLAAEGVHWHGYVEDLAEVYRPGSIALAPAMDRGGIKTKVLEAWAWGCPVLCNQAAMEGLALADYPFVLPEARWPGILTAPNGRDWAAAARLGHAFVRDTCSAERFERAWQEIVCPTARCPVANAGEREQAGFKPAGEMHATDALASAFARARVQG